MTICLAAIATENNMEHIVFATDHMVTTPVGSFEHPSVKYKIINDKTIAMLAGNPIIFNDLVDFTDTDILFEDMKGNIFDNFKRLRKETIQREIFDIYGINEEFFIATLANEIPNEHIAEILRNVAEYRLQSQILLIGFDDNGSAQIAEINDENMVNMRDMNCHAIGSGSIQAMNTLLFQKHDKKSSLLATIYNVYKAKRNAEVLEGVGIETELMVLTQNSGCEKVDTKDMELLRNIYEEELEFGKQHNRLNDLNLRKINVIAATKKI